ncbi:MAG: hypothetical protein HYU66_05945 [Armatimonadetes bacterium]|nr:hypothetical protein [Armatimonadota bacterium]
MEPEIRVSLSPSWMTLGEAATELALALQVPAGAAERARVKVTIEGAGKRVEAVLPGRVAERMKVRLAVGDLPAGRYTVTASLLDAGRTAEARAVLSRLAGATDGG